MKQLRTTTMLAAILGAGIAAAAVRPAYADEPDAERTARDPKTADESAAGSPEASLALNLLGSLSPENMKQFGNMLEQDWKNRPEWGDMAIAILRGERMRPGMGWWQGGLKRFDWSWLQGQFDANRDGHVSRDELPEIESVGDKLFERLDRDLDGKLTAPDFESDTAPNAPAATASNLLFNRLDADSNGRVSLDELAGFFAKADSGELGFLTPEDLRASLEDPDRKPAGAGSGGEPSQAQMVRMFLTGQLGWLESGPDYGAAAPDFTLSTHDGSGTVTLSALRGKKPVVLIFGSFT